MKNLGGKMLFTVPFKSTFLTEDSIKETIRIQSRLINLSKLPTWANIISSLPIGTGIKGGIARKILKIIVGMNKSNPDLANELNGEGDLDLLIAVPKISPELRLNLRKHYAGKNFGDMVVEAKDIEVSDSFSDFFLTRDITMNECVIFRESETTFKLYFSEQGRDDIERSLIRPAIHTLNSGFSQSWTIWQNQPIVGRQLFARAILRFLKGHGQFFAIDDITFSYYNHTQKGLNAVDLWRILRPFHKCQDKYLLAYRFLEIYGLIAPKTNDTERLIHWGGIMFSINYNLAQRNMLLNLAEPDAQTIENWLKYKEDQFLLWQFYRRIRVARGQRVTPDYRADVIFEDGLTNFPSFHNVLGYTS